MRRHDVFHQLHQVHCFPGYRAVGLFAVVVQQLFNQLLQVAAAAVEDLDDLLLLRRQRSGDPVGQQLGAFTHTGQRGFKLMRQMAKKLMPLRLQPCQALAEPDDALAHRAQLARASKQCRVVQRLPCAQLIDHSFDTFHRADDHAGEKQHQRQAQQKQHQRLPAEKLAALGNLLLQLLAAGIDHRPGRLDHVAVITGENFQSGGCLGVRAAVVTLQLRQIADILAQRLPELFVRQHAGVRVQHLAVALPLVLIDARQRRIVQHAVLAIAALHLQCGIDHRLAASGVDQGGTVNMRRLGAEGVQALPGLPGQHQQWQQDQHKRERHQLTQRTGEKRESLQGCCLNH